LPTLKADNHILGVTLSLQKSHPHRQVILVSKDINMRIKARALSVPAEDYFNDKVLEDTDLLYTGMQELPADFWDKHGKEMESWQSGGHTYYRVKGPLVSSFMINQFVFQEGDRPFYAIVRELDGNSAVLETLKDTAIRKTCVGHHRKKSRAEFCSQPAHEPANRFRHHDRAGGRGENTADTCRRLMHTLEYKTYTEIIMTRITVPVGEDIGFSPAPKKKK